MDKNAPAPSAEGKHRGAAFFAALAAFPGRLTDWLAASLIGRFFLGYDKSRELLRGSRMAHRVRASFLYRSLAPLRYQVARFFSHSHLTALYRVIVDMLRYTEARAYGILFGTFGVYTVLVYVIKFFAFRSSGADNSLLFTGVGVALFSLLFLFSRRPLCILFQENPIFNLLLCHVVGLQRYAYVRKSHLTLSPTLAFLIGSALGIAGFFLHPLWIIGGMLLALFFFLLLFSPELCLFSAIFLAPFLIFFERPAFLLAVILLIGAVGYIFKLLLGKRLFAFGPLDLAVLALLALYLGSSVLTRGGAASAAAALLCATLLSGYFLAVNLLRTPAMIRRAVTTLTASGTIVAAVGLLQQLSGLAIADWLDSSAYDYIGGRITSVFENPNVLAVFLILVFPFTVARILRRTGPADRIGAFLVFAVFMAAIVYTWSRGAWVGVILSLSLFLFVCKPALLYLLIPMLAGLPFLLGAIPSSIGMRLSSVTSLTDSSISYRLGIWRGSLSMAGDHLFGGIGVGEAAFRAVYPYYALSGIESAPHTHSLLLQLLCEFGIVGPLLFLGLLLLFYQCVLSHQQEEQNAELRLYSIAAGCGVFAVLVNGFTDYVFYNSRVFFLFFVVIGIAVALTRVGRAERLRATPISDRESSAASIDIPLL